ncbi:hypothetical protein Tco_0241210 [Tanacetum coccineum]
MDIVDESLEIDETVNIKESRNHPLENFIGNLNQRTLRSQAQNQSNFFCFISTIEPKNVNEALGDESWIVAMQEELNQLIANNVWELVLIEYENHRNNSTCQDMCDEFAKINDDEFEMSMMGELQLLPCGLQIYNKWKMVRVSLPIDGDLMSWHKVSLRMVRIKPNFLPLRTSFRLFELIEMVKSVASVMRKRLMENPELENESYVLYDRVMNPLAAQLERKPRRDHGTRRGRHSTSSSFAFDQPSLSHLNNDDDDKNDEGASRASTPSPIRYVNSLTNQVPQVFQNPPNIDPHLEPFYTRQTKIINRQVQLRDEQRGGVRSIGKSLRRLWRNMKK